jgi:hypothetical protein
MKFVLHLKHWQLFMLMFAIPFCLYIIFFMTMFIGMFNNRDRFQGDVAMPTVTVITLALVVIAYLTAIVIGASWAYNLATGLYKKLPAGSNMKIKRFYFAFFYPAIYIFLVLAGAGVFALTMVTRTGDAQTMSPMFGLVFLIIPLHFLAIACMFYIMYFIAKSLKSVELNREAQASDYIADFILIWFSFIGIWFIQPRVNQIFSDGPTPVTAGGPIDTM